MVKRLVLLFVISISLGTYSQKDSYLSLEALGSGGLGGLFYERDYATVGIVDFQYRLGFSMMPVDVNNGSVLIFPHMLHFVIGQKASRLDFGLGFTASITTKGQFFVRQPLSIGYRFEPPAKNFYLRASYTPIASVLIDYQWQHWGGLTFGLKISNRHEK